MAELSTALSDNGILLPEPFTRILNLLISQRIRIALESSQNYLEVETKRLKLKEIDRHRERQQMQLKLSYWRGITNSWLFMLATSSIFVSSGLFFGISLGLNLPEQVTCFSPNSICYILRFRDRRVQ